ncbi:prepilin-type N-terminal cleavage/methylation domain-containing protein [Qiania dongpingensis]|uniref:Prepilin-type N-terminal cleavage/methylation domain-containing protein n=1 Tax=Qiania dongpingensis TaxID=2763669 RepID=A0A7G9G5Q2_9FIRM|nr:prepilin-type N-terminal cleavage/methylation domain-containing protein [Qiania dongpingensis]QNM06134.1 prepilin-type N-terminal cleavage/methylation domain-containing protein [Qiania dongpingensis]
MISKLRSKAKSKKGFTLVELIVVIVIILILAAVMVPSMLKYIDRANKANCKADAATILSQVQADYAASQASEQTEVTIDWTNTGEVIGGVTVKIGTTAASNNAVFTVGDKDGYSEITAFTYNNGKYTATWDGTAWTVTKNS